MKTELKNSIPDKRFKPFEITFTIETIEEARLMYHICNDCTLSEKLLDPEYTGEVAPEISGNAYAKIRDEIEGQGFKI